MVGSGVGAKNGILFKTAASLEQTGRTTIAVLDKTGTITAGEPKVTDIFPSGVSENELLTLAYSLEKQSEHPLARAIMKKGEECGLAAREISSFEALPGNGLTALCGTSRLYGGNLAFISSKTAVPKDAEQLAEKLAEQGKTPLFFASDSGFSGHYRRSRCHQRG